MAAEQFGPYRLDMLIGRGGMGEVWRAADLRKDERTVAIKRLLREFAPDDDYRRRFRREARIAADLAVPHVIPIHDYGEIDGHLYIEMPFIDAVDLADTVETTGPLSVQRAARIVSQIARALAAAHRRHLVHRDIKPSNILVCSDETDPEDAFAYLVDFGIARPIDGTRLTRTGALIGSLNYLAPERIDPGLCDHRSDLYSLGCVLYEALTGRPPFNGDGPAQMYAHLHFQPPMPSRQRSDLSPAIDQVVGRAMAKNPLLRYQTANEFSVALRAAVQLPNPGTIRGGRPSSEQRSRTATRPSGSNEPNLDPEKERQLRQQWAIYRQFANERAGHKEAFYYLFEALRYIHEIQPGSRELRKELPAMISRVWSLIERECSDPPYYRDEFTHWRVLASNPVDLTDDQVLGILVELERRSKNFHRKEV